ncbi:MAG: 4-hydroxybenzoate octaprenyltransferase [SAR86 cluster bacterium]|jgi:4-hydroxybenzoate polyprenyltransferase|nr:4-hydroxybenzoate octaprenyltransferase [SAR86 cluster bacterium]
MENLLKKIKALSLLARIDKPIGTLLLLWPTLSSFCLLTYGNPSLNLILIFILGTFLMRSAGCIINDIFDREFDKEVLRTKTRPLVTKEITVKEALFAFVILICLSGFLLFFLNKLSLYMALIGLGLAILYPLTKRFFSIPQFFLGLAFSWGIIMVSAAELNQITINAWIMFLACFLWIIAYDTIYALVDKEDDLKIGINSSAISFGDKELNIILICHLSSTFFWAISGILAKVSIVFYIALFLAVLLSFYQKELIKEREKDKCFAAFTNNNWIGLSIFIGSFLGTI